MNKGITIVILALAALCSGASAQPKNACCPPPNSRGAGKMVVVDTTCIRVWYAFNADDVKVENTYIDHQRLDIGKRVTKYYSEFLFRSDSLIAEWKKKHPEANAVPGSLGNGGKKKDKWSEYEYSDLFISNGELTEYATMPLWLVKYNSFYTEPYPLQQWKMGTETRDILGHRCQKATCHWRGLRGVVCSRHSCEGWPVEVRWPAWSHSGVAGHGGCLSFRGRANLFKALSYLQIRLQGLQSLHTRKGVEDAEDIQ